jgi:hypothetical protein
MLQMRADGPLVRLRPTCRHLPLPLKHRLHCVNQLWSSGMQVA